MITPDMLGPYIVAFGIVFIAVLRLLLGRMIAQVDQRLDTLFDLIENMRKDITDSKVDVNRNFVTKSECQAHRSDIKRC